MLHMHLMCAVHHDGTGHVADSVCVASFSRFAVRSGHVNAHVLPVPRPQLKAALAELLEQPGAAKPERVRFFRGQMQTIITRAVTDLGMKPVPSRRCFTLISECYDQRRRCTSVLRLLGARLYRLVSQAMARTVSARLLHGQYRSLTGHLRTCTLPYGKEQM